MGMQFNVAAAALLRLALTLAHNKKWEKSEFPKLMF